MEVYLNGKVLDRSTWVPLQNFVNLEYTWPTNPNTYYTLIIYDTDAPTRDDPAWSPYLHQLVVNIPGDGSGAGVSITDFIPAAPPQGKGEHRYFVNVFAQKTMVPTTYITTHERFDLPQFIQQYQLVRVGQEVLVANPDSDHMYRAILDAPGLFYDPAHSLIKVDSLIPDLQKRYCSCVVSVASKQSRTCNTEKAWYEVRDGTKCYNPYAVCTKSVGRDSSECAKYYNYHEFSDDQLKSMASLRRIDLPHPWNRNQLIASLEVTKI